MNVQTNPNVSLSSSTSSKIDWKTINDVLGVAVDELGPDRSAKSQGSQSTTTIDAKAIRRAFTVVKDEFQRVLDPLRKQMKVVSMLIFVSLAISISGALISFINPWGGGILTITGVGALFGLLVRIWKLSRDQAMLELVPARYELALQMCTNPNQFSEILTQFMRETSSLQ